MAANFVFSPGLDALHRAPPGGIVLPTVIRYMKRKYVDEFFDTGRLMLSSFAQFGRHTDEQRLDQNEGSVIVTVIGPTSTTLMVVRQGLNAYVMCGSTREDATLMRAFDCDSYFRIRDLPRFAYAVSQQLGCTRVVSGECFYLDRPVIRRHMNYRPEDWQISPDGPACSMEKLHAFLSEAAVVPQAFLLKHTSFARQAEFRFVWFVPQNVDGQLTIECPAARAFCDRP